MHLADLLEAKSCLTEAAIDASAIALAADKVLYDTFLDLVKKAARTAIHSYAYAQGNDFNPKSLPGDEHAYAVHQHVEATKTRASGAYACIYAASKVLTKLVQDTVLKEYGVPDGPAGVVIDQDYYPIENVLVHIRHAHGGGEQSDAGGYMLRGVPARRFFLPQNHPINPEYPEFAGIEVTVHDTNGFKSDFDEAVLNQIYLDITGEPYEGLDDIEYNLDNMVGHIVPTFAHEYDHLLFYLKKPKSTKYSSRSMLSNKVSGRAYDNHLDVNDPDSYARYLASDIELQAWASGEAARLVRQIVLTRRRPYSTHHDPSQPSVMRDPVQWNAAIDAIIAKVRKPPARWMEHSHQYQERIKRKVGGNAVVYQKIWQRYLKLLIAKLLHYKKA